MSNSNVIGLLVLLVYLKSKFFQSNTMSCNEKHCPSLAYGIALPPVVRCNPLSAFGENTVKLDKTRIFKIKNPTDF